MHKNKLARGTTRIHSITPYLHLSADDETHLPRPDLGRGYNVADRKRCRLEKGEHHAHEPGDLNNGTGRTTTR